MRRVELSARAENDLARPAAFLVDKSPAAARRAAQAISDAVLSLGEFPNRGRPGPVGDLRELRVAFGRDGYLVRYQLREDCVLVTRIVHSRERR
jgi:plasmid stabilization system protein ParE